MLTIYRNMPTIYRNSLYIPYIPYILYIFWVNYSIGWNLGRWDIQFRTFWSGNQLFCLLRPETETSEGDLRFGEDFAQNTPHK